jgi:serine O-acetyltransferase
VESDQQKPLGLWQTIREDLKCYDGWWGAPGFQAVLFYRIGTWAARLPRVLGLLPSAIYKVGSTFVRCLYGIELYRSAKIGRRFRIGHQNGIVLHHKVEIGKDCVIRQNVTIGQTMHGRPPKLGDRVDVGAGAVIFGQVTIGNDVRIGPNCVVLTDIPDGATVFVPPPKVLQLRKPKKPTSIQPASAAQAPSPSHDGRTDSTVTHDPQTQAASPAGHAADQFGAD